MDFDLTDEQRLIKETAREFTDREIVERTKINARNHHFDLDLVAKVAAQGYLGAIVPQEYGGAGLDYRTYGLIVEEIGRGDSAIRTVISVQTSLVCSAILKWGTEEQRHEYLPKLCSGEWLGCFGLTEPDTGSDAANQKTRAVRNGDGWIINGGKMWISMGDYAKVALIFAQTDPSLGHKGLACFLVDTDQDGLQTPADRAQDGAPRLRHGVDRPRRRGGHRRADAGRDRRRLQGGDVGPGLGPLLRRGRVRRASARGAWRSRSATPRSANSSVARSRASSSSRG